MPLISKRYKADESDRNSEASNNCTPGGTWIPHINDRLKTCTWVFFVWDFFSSFFIFQFTSDSQVQITKNLEHKLLTLNTVITWWENFEFLVTDSIRRIVDFVRYEYNCNSPFSSLN